MSNTVSSSPTVADITAPRGVSDHTVADPAVRTGDEPTTIETAEDAKEPFLAALGERAKALRVRRGLTRKALARATGVSERHLANLSSYVGRPQQPTSIGAAAF